MQLVHSTTGTPKAEKRLVPVALTVYFTLLDYNQRVQLPHHPTQKPGPYALHNDEFLLLSQHRLPHAKRCMHSI